MGMWFRSRGCWALLMANSMSFLGYFNFKNIPFKVFTFLQEEIFNIYIPDIFFFLYIYHQFMLIFCAFDNDDMESSKRRVSFFVVDFSFKKDIQFMVTIET